MHHSTTVFKYKAFKAISRFTLRKLRRSAWGGERGGAHDLGEESKRGGACAVC